MRKLVILLLLVFTVFTVACSKNDDSEQVKEEPAEVEKETKKYPFTGIETEEDVTNRAVAVMVSNQTQARPQTGLSKADIVFEMLTEGNITRFMAIYQSTQP